MQSVLDKYKSDLKSLHDDKSSKFKLPQQQQMIFDNDDAKSKASQNPLKKKNKWLILHFPTW